jgi:hypothetical protein
VNAAKTTAKPFSAEEFIDRVAERELFGSLVGFQDEARLLTIRDESDRGKTHLLKLLRYTCQYASTPAIPVTFVPLDELKQKAAYSFARAVVNSLRDNFNLDFGEFRAVSDERIKLLLEAVAPRVAGKATAADVAEGASVAGVIVGGDLVVSGGAQLDPDVEERLQERAVEAFLADLRQVASNRPVVLLIDAYEESGERLDQWITKFLRDHVFDKANRLENLVVVIAGQHVPTARFKLMLGTRFDRVVKSVESLSLWEPEHVKRFLEVNRVTGYADEDVALICAKLQKGWSIGRAVAAVEQYLREGAGP